MLEEIFVEQSKYSPSLILLGFSAQSFEDCQVLLENKTLRKT